MAKTNVIRILGVNNIPHTIHSYDVDESDLSGETVAQKSELKQIEFSKHL